MTPQEELEGIILKELNEYNEFGNLPFPERGKKTITTNLASLLLSAGYIKKGSIEKND